MPLIFEGLFVQGELINSPPLITALKNNLINGELESINKLVTLKNFLISGNDDKIRKVYGFEFNISERMPLIENTLPQENVNFNNTPQIFNTASQTIIQLLNTPQIILAAPSILSPPMTRISYPFEFNILERLSYPFDFNILSKYVRPFYFNIKTGTRYNFYFNILQEIKNKITYEGFYFNITELNKITYNFDFDIVPSRFYFDFNIIPNLVYPFDFNIIGNQRLEYDFMFDIIETWCSVALTASATPILGGTITPSSSKKRLNLRVFYDDILAGAGTATYLWNGSGNAKILCRIGEIPILGGTMTIKIYENSVLKYNAVAPAAEAWSGYYGTA